MLDLFIVFEKNEKMMLLTATLNRDLRQGVGYQAEFRHSPLGFAPTSYDFVNCALNFSKLSYLMANPFRNGGDGNSNSLATSDIGESQVNRTASIPV